MYLLKSEFRIEMNAIFFLSRASSFTELLQDVSQGPVVRRLISANPGLNLIKASLSFFFLPLGYFSLFFLVHPITKMWTKRMKLNFLFKVSYLNSNFTLTKGYH